uniref:efflux RND transporter permease subunit n=1 Tax=Escherichia coli TaxID=562 RepID=UPI0013D15094
ILISLVVSLTTTAMMCSVLLRKEERGPRGRLYRASEAAFEAMFNFYRSTLSWTLGHPRLIMLLLLATLCLNGYL